MSPDSLVHLLRNTPVQKLIRALEKDGFTFKGNKGSNRIYRDTSNGRRVVIHYHKGKDVLPRGTLGSVLNGAQWTQEDVKRLGLL